MSTRARIALANPGGSYTSIYTHRDGYPTHHAPILATHYASADKLRALLALGDLSILDSSIGEPCDFDAPPAGQCLAYGRDRGESGCDACRSETLAELMDLCTDSIMYLYILYPSGWKMYDLSQPEPTPTSLDGAAPKTTTISAAQTDAVAIRTRVRSDAGRPSFVKPGESQRDAVARMKRQRRAQLGRAAGERAKMPRYWPGMSTLEYVAVFLDINDGPDAVSRGLARFEPLNTRPAALYENGALDFEPEIESIEATPAPLAVPAPALARALERAEQIDTAQIPQRIAAADAARSTARAAWWAGTGSVSPERAEEDHADTIKALTRECLSGVSLDQAAEQIQAGESTVIDPADLTDAEHLALFGAARQPAPNVRTPDTLRSYWAHCAARGDRPRPAWLLAATGRGYQPAGYVLGWSIGPRRRAAAAAERQSWAPGEVQLIRMRPPA